MNETTELLFRQFNQKKTHAETHELGGGDEIDVAKLKGISNYVTMTGDFSGTWNGLQMTSVEPGLSSAFNALKAETANKTTANLTIYVSLAGSDDNDGLTAVTPYRTIKKAIDAIPNVVNHHIVIQLADGTYTDTMQANSGANIDTYTTAYYTCLAAFTNINIHEGASITLKGNPGDPSKVVLDGLGTTNIGLYVLETKRINVNGITIKGHTLYGLHYKRYASGMIKNVVTDGGQYGLFDYEFCFVEIQGNTTIKNATQYGVLVQALAFLNATGLNMQANAKGVLVMINSHCELNAAESACTLSNSADQITIDHTSYIYADTVTFTSDVRAVINNGGRIKMNSCTLTSNYLGAAIELKLGGFAEILSSNFDSGVSPASSNCTLISVKDQSKAYIYGGTIQRGSHNVYAEKGSSIYVENIDLKNAKFDGINANDSSVQIKSVSSSTQNGRRGVQLLSCDLTDHGSNTVTGVSGQFSGTNMKWPIKTGATASRPTTFLGIGTPYFDTTLGYMIWYNGSAWKNASGTTV